MLSILRRMFSATTDPDRTVRRPVPTDSDLANALGLVRVELVPSDAVAVRSYTRKKPVNPKTAPLHEELRRAVGR